jgi:hypothetical protein
MRRFVVLSTLLLALVLDLTWRVERTLHAGQRWRAETTLPPAPTLPPAATPPPAAPLPPAPTAQCSIIEFGLKVTTRSPQQTLYRWTHRQRYQLELGETAQPVRLADRILWLAAIAQAAGSVTVLVTRGEASTRLRVDRGRWVTLGETIEALTERSDGPFYFRLIACEPAGRVATSSPPGPTWRRCRRS